MFSFFRQKWGDTKGATEARTDGHGHFQSVLFQPQIMCQIVQLDLTPEKHQLEMSMNINALECSECSRCHWSSDKRRKTSPGPQNSSRSTKKGFWESKTVDLIEFGTVPYQESISRDKRPSAADWHGLHCIRWISFY
ncbi:hypothetical protein J6590_091422 [Homalodisca vitripennis]|nr:hypothetical protein J6590_091422 [Homalodisca vitripennis]